MLIPNLLNWAQNNIFKNLSAKNIIKSAKSEKSAYFFAYKLFSCTNFESAKFLHFLIPYANFNKKNCQVILALFAF
jgi:hypothetical protein